MRIPTFFFGLVALLAVPALLPAQEAGKAAPGASKASAATGKDSKKSAKTKTAVKKVLAKAKARPKGPPAKNLFGVIKVPAALTARSIGFYAKGCLAGAEAMPIDGPAWQAMRISRNRNWGHPELIALVKKLATEAKAEDGWPGLLVGDISQPRGGPMLTGHASHQIGLDADVWLTPMPDRTLTPREREDISATSMLSDDAQSVNPKVWTDAHVRLLKRAASYEQVERVLVHPAIKKAVCEASKNEKDRDWLSKIRPYWGHYYHFHVRIACPKGSAGCEGQPAVDDDNDGCGAELTQWLKRVKRAKAPPVPPKTTAPPPKKKPPLTLEQLPKACRAVLASGDPPPSVREALSPPKTAIPAPKEAVPAPKAAPPKQAKTER